MMSNTGARASVRAKNSHFFKASERRVAADQRRLDRAQRLAERAAERARYAELKANAVELDDDDWSEEADQVASLALLESLRLNHPEGGAR